VSEWVMFEASLSIALILTTKHSKQLRKRT